MKGHGHARKHMAADLMPILQANIAAEAILMTDEASQCRGNLACNVNRLIVRERRRGMAGTRQGSGGMPESA